MGQQVKLVNGKLVAEEGNGGDDPEGKRHWYEIPDAQYQKLVAIAREDGLELEADNPRGQTIKRNKAIITIINLVAEDFIQKRQAMKSKTPAGEPQAGKLDKEEPKVPAGVK